MADAGLFVGWGQAVRGREVKGLQVLNEAVEFWTGQQQSGAISNFEVVLLAPHGGDLAGFMLVRGSQEQIAAVHANEDFERIIARANVIVDRLGVIDAVLGDGLAPVIARYEEVIAEFA
jgi:hypothetical protein